MAGIARVLFDQYGNAIKVTQDGSDYKYEFLGKLRNIAGTIINPATEESLSAMDTKLGTIDSVLDSIKDTDGIKKITDALPAGDNNIGNVDVVSSALPTGAATETTLSSADSKLGTIDGVLDSIKDTDGIKKITDELPAGTQEIGLVAQGTPADDENAWPVKQVTASGGEYKVYHQGSEYIPAAESLAVKSLLQDMLIELRLLNMHMQMITELALAEDDLEEEGIL